MVQRMRSSAEANKHHNKTVLPKIRKEYTDYEEIK